MPLNDPEATSVLVNLTATPMENAEASGGNEKKLMNPQYIYTIDEINMNTNISSWPRKYTTFQEATTEFGYPTAIANEVENGRATATYIAFERNGHVYYIRGGINESSSPEKPIYDQNVSVLKEAYGPDWESMCTDNGSDFNCDADDIMTDVASNGDLYAGMVVAWYCMYNNNQSYCSG